MSPKFRNLDTTKSYYMLKNLDRVSLKKVLTPERVSEYTIPTGGGLIYNYAAKTVNESIIDELQNLAEEQQLIMKYEVMLKGAYINTGEQRMVLHQLTRGELEGPVIRNGKDQGAFYREQQERIKQFSRDVHTGKIKGSTGKTFDAVVQIGIGGSGLGPRALYLALEDYTKPTLKAFFISNIDPDEPNAVLNKVDLETTLFILVTKSGTTLETLANSHFVLEKSRLAGIKGFDPSKHMIAVTSETSPLAKSSDFLDSFYIDDYIGGRYSSTSAVGGVILNLAFGSEIFEQILAGATEADRMALDPDIRKNAALMDAMIGVYERNILCLPVTAVMPYCEALARFPAHLQQLDMESNGKSVNRQGEAIHYATGPVLFGDPGTNGQHSFYQMLHQGTYIVPLQFIGFHDPQINSDLAYKGTTSQQKLNANLAAQIVAFAVGKSDKDPNKNFNGERPSSVIVGDKLTPKSLGALLAHFENKVMFQGFTWNVDSYDQEGVQLGKKLAMKILDKSEKMSPVLKAYADLLSIYREM